eukprot:764229-Hanusia_phi.AAC.2
MLPYHPHHSTLPSDRIGEPQSEPLYRVSDRSLQWQCPGLRLGLSHSGGSLSELTELEILA